MNLTPDCITVVIPTYNRRAKLQIAVDSVLQEVRVPITLHIFDNASTDGTPEYLRALSEADPRVVVTKNDCNVGASANYTKALASVDSAYYLPLADDDWLVQNFLFEAFNLLQSHPAAAAAVFFAESRNAQGDFVCTYPDRLNETETIFLSPREHLRQLMTHGHYVWSSILWKKETLAHVGYPYLHTGLPSDVDFQFQVFSQFPVTISPKIGAIYNVHGNNASTAFSIRDIPSWSKLLSRMDRSASPHFDAAEYAGLRASVIARYRGIWALPPKDQINKKRLVLLAAVAGARLGDWDLASSLLDRKQLDGAQQDESLLSILLLNVLETRKALIEFEEKSKIDAKELERLEEALSEITHSKSWRMTRVFRLAGRAVGKLDMVRKTRRAG